MTTAILRDTFTRIRKNGGKRALDAEVFGRKFGIMASLFGCWHENLSRPFGHGKMAYRTCLQCGARAPFDMETLVTQGKFYQPPAVRPLA